MNRIPPSFTDARTATRAKQTPIGHRLGWMLLIFEGYARAKAYLWVSNAELAAAYGCSVSACQRVLEDMEADGIIRRVMTEDGRRGRIGIILLKRANPDLPVADKDSLDAITDQMRGRKQGPSSTAKTGCSAPRKQGPSSTAKTGCGIKTLSFKNEDSKNDAGEGEEIPISQPPERQRPADPIPQADNDSPDDDFTTVLEDPRYFQECEQPEGEAAPVPAPESPPPLPSASVEPKAPDEEPPPSLWAAARAHLATAVAESPPKAEDPPLPPMTPGQAAWLAGLGTEQRTGFDQKRPEKQAWILEHFKHGPIDDPIIAKAIADELKPRVEAWEQPRPRTTVGLLESLPGHPQWPHLAAAALVQEFGAEENQKFYLGFLTLAEAVCHRTFPAWRLVDAYKKAKKPGCNKPGAVFNTLMQRDHGWRWPNASTSP